MFGFLNEDFTEAEVKAAVFDFCPYKAPGPDRFHALFYQKAWGVVGKDVTEACLSILNRGVPVKDLNLTNIVLILDRAADHLQEYQNKGFNVSGVSESQVEWESDWVPPPIGNFKLNIDAAVKTRLSHMGACVVIRDSEGKVITASYKALISIFSPELGVNSVNNVLSPAGLIVNGIKALCKDVDAVSSQAISKDGNASICSSSAQHRLTLFCPTSIDSLLPSQSFTETNLSSRPIYSSSARPICFKG
ncbi:hypothetical protein LWI29_000638 [Acer saccharum]|uniref:Uncharacterized protein n=1 Tax=Acer saccharum TaxID=4024 RepID=A0AA39TMT8_ACESA|nr:hypothetical protein LWI29_000638 [Acer saccharum]